ncbi:MAG: cysteine--tRNA ligase, partial [Candidatus Omnitrophica bacterium]|nr:cysteine--tRNA ligase [Candidatus Omnitrophota bacterium]
KYLETETLDIHAGGRDLIFPHHENEIAQSEALTGKPFAKYWIHHGLLTINGRKMAKSLGNFVSIKDFLKENIPQVLKLFFLSAHYRSPVDYNEKRIREAKKNYERFRILFDKLNRKFSKEKTPAKPVKPDKDSIKFRKRFEETMDDDFNTPEALAVLFDLASFCNKLLDNYKDNYREILLSAEDILQDYCKIFGITFKTHVKEIKSDAYIRMVKGISRTEIESLVKSREDLRKKGNFSEADRIRKRLEEKDIILEDTKEGTIWRRKI